MPPFLQGIGAGVVAGMVLWAIYFYSKGGISDVVFMFKVLGFCCVSAVVAVLVLKTFFAEHWLVLGMDSLIDELNNVLIHWGLLDACDVRAKGG